MVVVAVIALVVVAVDVGGHGGHHRIGGVADGVVAGGHHHCGGVVGLQWGVAIVTIVIMAAVVAVGCSGHCCCIGG